MPIVEVGGPQAVGKTSTIEKATKLAHKEIHVIKRSIVLATILGVDAGEVELQPADRLEAAREQMHTEVESFRNGVRDSHFREYTLTSRN